MRAGMKVYHMTRASYDPKVGGYGSPIFCIEMHSVEGRIVYSNYRGMWREDTMYLPVIYESETFKNQSKENKNDVWAPK